MEGLLHEIGLIYIYMIKPHFEQNKLFEFLIETKLVSQYGGHVTRNFSYYVDIESFKQCRSKGRGRGARAPPVFLP